MKTVRIALIAGSALLFAAGATGLAACGSDDNTGFPTGTGSTKDATAPTQDAAGNGDDDSGNSNPGVDSGGSGDDDSNTTDSGGNNNGDDDSGSPSTDGGAKTAADCGANFKIPSTTEKNYCFHAPVGADDAGTCSGSKPSCCDTETSGGSFTNTCTSDTTGSACTAPSGGKAYFYGCGQNSDCTKSGQLCYIFPYADSDGGSIFIGGTCGYVPLASGSICATKSTAPAGSTPACVTDSDCTGQPNMNTKCNTVSIHSKYFGACTTE